MESDDATTPPECTGAVGEEALLGSSVISCSLGDWSQAAFTGAERKTWPSQRLFKISPVRKRVEGTATDDEIAESLRGLKRAQLQKIAKTLRINPTQPTEQLVAEIAECTSSVLRQREEQPPPAEDAPPARDADAVMREAEWADLTEAERSAASLLGYSPAGWDSGDKAPLQAPWAELEAQTKQAAVLLGMEKSWFGRGVRRRRVAGGLRVEVESPCGQEPKSLDGKAEVPPQEVAERQRLMRQEELARLEAMAQAAADQQPGETETEEEPEEAPEEEPEEEPATRRTTRSAATRSAAAASEECPHCVAGSGKLKGHRGRHLRKGAAAKQASAGAVAVRRSSRRVPVDAAMQVAAKKTRSRRAG